MTAQLFDQVSRTPRHLLPVLEEEAIECVYSLPGELSFSNYLYSLPSHLPPWRYRSALLHSAYRPHLRLLGPNYT